MPQNQTKMQDPKQGFPQPPLREEQPQPMPGKGAIVTFTKALAEFALEQKGVRRVNAVAPGPVWTPLISSSMPKEHFWKFGENGPMKRTAQPAELAPAYVFLASQESSYFDGEVLGVTGGKSLA